MTIAPPHAPSRSVAIAALAELTGPSRCGPDIEPVCRIDGAVLVTDPQLVETLLSDRRLRASRPAPPWWARREARAAAAFFAAWPMFSDGPVHVAGRALAKSAVEGALAALSGDRAREQVAAIVAGALRPGEAAHDWAGGEARSIVRRLLAACAGVDGPELAALEVFAQIVLDELAVVGSTRSGRRRLLGAGDEIVALLAACPSADGLVAPYAAALRSRAIPPAVVLGSFAQVITGLLDPLIGAVAAVPLVVAAGALDGVDDPAARVATTLGLASPFRFTSRFAAEPTDVCGVRVRAGERLVLHLGAASLAKLERGETTRLAHFGVGAHYCLGARVATLVVGQVLEALAGRSVEVHSCVLLPTLFLRFARLDVSYA